MENRMESLRQNWFVIQQLIKRDKQRSLSSTFMGELWEIINPLINMIVMVLVFGKMFGYGMAGGFPLYVLTGTTLYGLFTSGTTMCLQALMGNKNFLIKTQLNRNVYVIQKILLAFRNFLFSLMIYAFVIALYRISPSVTWLLFIPDVFLLLSIYSALLFLHLCDYIFYFSVKINAPYQITSTCIHTYNYPQLPIWKYPLHNTFSCNRNNCIEWIYNSHYLLHRW